MESIMQNTHGTLTHFEEVQKVELLWLAIHQPGGAAAAAAAVDEEEEGERHT